MRTRYKIQIVVLPSHDLNVILLKNKHDKIVGINVRFGLDDNLKDLLSYVDQFNYEFMELFQKVAQENVGYGRKKLIKMMVEAWYNKQAEKHNKMNNPEKYEKS